MDLLEKIENLITKDIESFGLILWGIEVFGSGKFKTLRVFIDSMNGITLDNCTKVSSHIGALLDTDELLDDAYTLEVSSPGVDRKFFKNEQYSLFLGSNLKIRYKNNIVVQRSNP